jgi:pantoate--beta-alanine ligase
MERSFNGPFKSIKTFNSTIGFVPLWAHYIGHLSLMQNHIENDYTVVSIFVNPTQFNNPELIKIPKDIGSRYQQNIRLKL